MKWLINFTFIIFSAAFIYYLAIPSSHFPEPMNQVLISGEPADIETPERRAYYLDYGRLEVIEHYKKAFQINVFGLTIRPLRLNYPPEEAQTLVRDQTRSTFLEELVFPFRESLYINGFEPQQDKDSIVIEERKYRQKIIVKHQKSGELARLSVGFLTLAFIYIFASRVYSDLKKEFKLWT